MPPLARCQVCHPRTALAEPAARIYKLPDFVNFSHARHTANCSVCHGAVYVRDIQPVLPMTMKACVDCHRARRASVSCTVCHELNQ